MEKVTRLRIRELCDERGLSISALAKAIGVTQPSVSNIVSMKNSARTDTLRKIADALNVEVWELFVSRSEVLAGVPQFSAMVMNGEDFYYATSLSELRGVVDAIEREGLCSTR